MKIEQIQFLVYSLLACLLALLVLEQLGLLQGILGLLAQGRFLFLSLILVFIFEPLIEWIPWFSRAVRCTLVYFSLLILIALFFVLVIPVLVRELSQIESAIRSLSQIPVFESALSGLKKIDPGQGIAFAYQSTVGLFHSISDFSLSYLAAYFISLDLFSILKLIRKHGPHLDQFRYFYATCSNVLFHYMKGLALDLLFLFVSTSLLLSLFRFKNPFIFALVLSFFNLIPYIGAAVGEGIILLVDLISLGQLRLELLLALFLLQQVEANFVQPFIFQKVLDIKPIVTLISILVFGYLFGFAGLILAPVLAVIVQLAYRSYVYTKVRKKIGTWENMWYNFDEIGEEDK